MRPLRIVVSTAVAVSSLGLLTHAAAAQVPPVPSEPPCVPGLTCPTEEPPTTSPAPDPTPSPTPPPTSSPTAEPTPSAEPSPTTEPSPLPSFDIAPPQPLDVAPPEPVDQGQPPVIAPDPAQPTGTGTGAPYAVLVATDRDIAQALTGSSVLMLLAAAIGAVAFGGTYRLTTSGVLAAHLPDGGLDVDTTRRWRTWASLGAFGVAGIVAIVGFVRIAAEPLVPIQLVYLASTGLAVVILAAIGGALLVSEQLRGDEHRLQEIERSLAVIASHVAAGIADPPRLLDRGETDTDADD